MNEAFWDSVLKETDGKVELKLNQPLTIKVGEASLTLSPSGEIVLKGTSLRVEGSEVKVKAQASAEVTAGGIVTLTGAILKLN